MYSDSRSGLITYKDVLVYIYSQIFMVMLNRTHGFIKRFSDFVTRGEASWNNPRGTIRPPCARSLRSPRSSKN